MLVFTLAEAASQAVIKGMGIRILSREPAWPTNPSAHQIQKILIDMLMYNEDIFARPSWPFKGTE